MNVEILAPGGSKEAIYAGLYSGADAVYTGTSRFSARAFADNPDVDELCRLLDFAHLHGKKIYLTVNTLLTEEELEGSLFEMLAPLYQAGLDAVIVQDYGVMDLIHESFPQLDIHASTQMTLVTGDSANLLKPYGVTRIVPARELSIQEIRAMRDQTELELEVFVHGALCYCYSGQCLMSKVIGGRSGNRGMCAQPCRLPYEVQGKSVGYILSPKDMCTLEHTGELIQAGVNSFKIEGRMKKPAYAALTSYLYRTYADGYLSGVTPDDKEVQRDIQRLQDIYNRGGFSGGYLFEPSKKNIIYPKKNGHFGVQVGEVTKVERATVKYCVSQDTAYQDVLEFRNDQGEAVYEYTVKDGAASGETVTARYKKGSTLRVGQGVYRTKNQRLLEDIERRIEEGKVGMDLPVQGHFVAEIGKPTQLTMQLGCATCTVTGMVVEPASGRPVSGEDIKKRLNKTGGSGYYFDELETTVEHNAFLPLGGIAKLRRSGFERLEQEFLQTYHRELAAKVDAENDALQESQGVWEVSSETRAAFSLIQVTSFSQIQGVKSVIEANDDGVRLHVRLEAFSPKEWQRLAEEVREFKYYISLPGVLRLKNRDLFFKYWEQYGSYLTQGGCVGVIAGSLEAVPIYEQIRQPQWELVADVNLYMWNQRSRKICRELGFSGHVYAAYGRRTVMITEGCVTLQLQGCEKTSGECREILIQTPKKDEFIVANRCDYCYNVIYEKEASWQEKEDLADILEITFTFEDADEVREVLKQWKYSS